MSFSVVSVNGCVCLERLFFSWKLVEQSMSKSSKPGSPGSTKSGQFSSCTMVTEQTQQKEKPGIASQNSLALVLCCTNKLLISKKEETLLLCALKLPEQNPSVSRGR